LGRGRVEHVALVLVRSVSSTLLFMSHLLYLTCVSRNPWLSLPCSSPLPCLAATDQAVQARIPYTGPANIFLEVEGGERWDVTFLPHKPGLSGGWIHFAQDNRLAVGDAVLFHKQAATANVLKVPTSREHCKRIKYGRSWGLCRCLSDSS